MERAASADPSRDRAVSPKSEDAVWSLVMFDLPVLTKAQRRRATKFRVLLLDLGYQRAQLSVYARFSPSVSSVIPAISTIKRNLPEGGEVRVFSITDHQWASALRFSNAKAQDAETAPSQLAIF